MPPEQHILHDRRNEVARLAPSVILFAGQALDASKHTLISHDAGTTWTYLRPYNIASGAVTATNGRFARHYEYFTTDSARSWAEYPLPDSLSTSSSPLFDYIGNGLFAISDRATRRWYTVDATTGVYAEANIPYAVRQVYLLPNGDLMGSNADPAPTTTVWRRRRDSADFVPIAVPVPDGLRPDSMTVKRSTVLANGMLAMVCETVPAGRGWLLVTDGDTARTVAAWDVADSLRSFGSIDCNGASTVLLRARNAADYTVALVALDLRTWQTRTVEMRGRTMQPSIGDFGALFMNDTLAVTINGDGSVHRLDLRTGEISLGGEVHDPYERFKPWRQDAVALIGGRLLVMDETGTVQEQRDDTTSILRAWGGGMNQRTTTDGDRFYRRVLASTLVHGTGHMWDAGAATPADDALVVGGPQLRRIDAAGLPTVLRADTTTFWIRRADGTQLAGHRTVQQRAADDTAFADHGRIGDGRAVIRHMAETSDGALVAGLRGYVHTVDGGAPDTLRGGLWRSADGGRTWQRVLTPVADDMVLSVQRRAHDGSLWACVTSALRESVADSVVEALQVPGEVITTGQITLLRSYDHGATWRVVHTQASAGGFTATMGNVAFAGRTTVVWAAMDRVHWSDDDGASWRILDGLRSGTSRVGAAAFDKNGNLWVAASDGLYKADRPTSVEARIDEPRSRSTPTFWATTHPNPTDRTLTLRLHNMDRLQGTVETLAIVDLLGREVADLREYVRGHRPSGIVDIPIDLGPVPSGPYVLAARTAERTFTWPVLVTDNP
jgi:hypothetical protein